MQVESNKEKNQLNSRQNRLTLLQLMSALVILGLMMTWVIHEFFMS